MFLENAETETRQKNKSRNPGAVKEYLTTITESIKDIIRSFTGYAS